MLAPGCSALDEAGAVRATVRAELGGPSLFPPVPAREQAGGTGSSRSPFSLSLQLTGGALTVRPSSVCGDRLCLGSSPHGVGGAHPPASVHASRAPGSPSGKTASR